MKNCGAMPSSARFAGDQRICRVGEIVEGPVRKGASASQKECCRLKILYIFVGQFDRTNYPTLLRRRNQLIRGSARLEKVSQNILSVWGGLDISLQMSRLLVKAGEISFDLEDAFDWLGVP